MKDNTEQLFELLKELSQHSVKFVVCGGLACVIHGVERSTYDLDISIDFAEENVKKIIEITKKFGLVPRISEPVENLFEEAKRNEWINKKGALVYTFVSLNGPMQIDIFLTYPLSYEELLKNADTAVVEDNIKFLISSKEDLILVKKMVEPLRIKDEQDIRELTAIINEQNK